MAGLPIFTDLPLWETKQDSLGFVSDAEALVNAIRDTPGPFTIGIFGEWGTGKTSLMQLVKNSFTNEDKIFPIWFNAWQYEQEEHPLVPLIAIIVSQLQQNATFVQSLGPDKSASLLETMRTLASHQSLKVKFKLAGAELEWAPDLQALRKAPPKKGFWSRLFKSAPTGPQLPRLLDQSICYHALDTLADIKIGLDCKVVVFIDDLDRCFPDKAIKLLESLKLILSQGQGEG